jgi:hypothetical protein
MESDGCVDISGSVDCDAVNRLSDKSWASGTRVAGDMWLVNGGASHTHSLSSLGDTQLF